MLQSAKTDRLLLRKPQPDDAQAFFDLFSDAETCRMDGGYPPYAGMDAAFWADFRAVVADTENRLFIEERACGRMIGLLHVMPSDAPDEVEIGYAIHRDFRRRGFAAEALRALLDQLKSSGITGVCATCYVFNAASAALLLHLGFTETVQQENAQHPEFSERCFHLSL